MLKTTNQPMAIYHWWNDNPDVLPYQDMSNPVIPSIVTLRAHNSKIPISVLDLSCHEKNWGIFPELLKFQVIKWMPKLNLSLHKSSKLCSRVWDVWEFTKKVKNDQFLFTDSDIFWLKNPLPFTKQNPEGKLEKFFCNSNTGVWYFDKNLPECEEIFRLWKFIIARILIQDEDFFEELSIKVPTALDGRPFQDEVAFGYLITQYPHLYNSIDADENYTIYRLLNETPAYTEIKCLHGLAGVLGNRRGLICLILKELRAAIEKVLNKEIINLVFGNHNFPKMYSIQEIKALGKEEIKTILEFTGCQQIDKLISNINKYA